MLCLVAKRVETLRRDCQRSFLLDFLYDVLAGGHADNCEPSRERPKAIGRFPNEQDLVVMEHRTADIDLWCRIAFREVRNQALDSLNRDRTKRPSISLAM